MRAVASVRVLVPTVFALAWLAPGWATASTFTAFACAPLTSECQDLPVTDPTGPLSLSAQVTPPNGDLGEAAIAGSLGQVQGFTNAVISATNTSPGIAVYTEGLNTQAGSQWEDNWTVSSPGLAGTTGTLRASILVDTTAEVMIDTLPPNGGLAACAGAGWTLSLAGGNGGVTLVAPVGGSGICEDISGFYPQDFGSDGVFAFDVPIVFGQEHNWDLQWRATSQVYGWIEDGGSLTGSAYLEFNALQWLGITEIVDSEGTPVDFSMTSVSGVDWTQAVPLQVVPLPATGWLLLTAVAGAVARTRRVRGVRTV